MFYICFFQWLIFQNKCIYSNPSNCENLDWAKLEFNLFLYLEINICFWIHSKKHFQTISGYSIYPLNYSLFVIYINIYCHLLSLSLKVQLIIYELDHLVIKNAAQGLLLFRNSRPYILSPLCFKWRKMFLQQWIVVLERHTLSFQ